MRRPEMRGVQGEHRGKRRVLSYSPVYPVAPSMIISNSRDIDSKLRFRPGMTEIKGSYDRANRHGRHGSHDSHDRRQPQVCKPQEAISNPQGQYFKSNI